MPSVVELVLVKDSVSPVRKWALSIEIVAVASVLADGAVSVTASDREAAEGLAADGLVVLETDARSEPELPLPVRTSRKYGQTRVTLFEAQQ